MNPEVHIDNIRLDLSGVSPEVARAAAGELSSSLQRAIAHHLATRTAPMSATVPSLPTVTVQIGAGADARTIRDAIAHHVATAIAGQMPTKKT